MLNKVIVNDRDQKRHRQKLAERINEIVEWTISNPGGPGSVDSVNGNTGVVVLDADDIAATASRLWLTQAERDSLAALDDSNVSRAVTLSRMPWVTVEQY